MTNFLIAIGAMVLALAGIAVRKAYYALPLRELKRRAARRDRTAAQLYRAAAYGSSLRSLLWLYIGLTSAVGLVELARLLPLWLSLAVVGLLLWVAFSLLPASRVSRAATGLAVLVTPTIVWLLDRAHPWINRGTGAVERRYRTAHTGLFEREDLLELIERQHRQPDNRLTDEELEIVSRTLKFDNYRVGDTMIPINKIKSVLAGDTVGPILIDEVHKSGQDFALVRDTSKGELVGSLALRQLNIESKGRVRDIMHSTVYYLHENDSLSQALHAFFVTNCPLFVVVNNAEEHVGVLTVSGVLKQLLGHIPGDDFDQYSDPAAVAARHTVGTSEETPVKTDDEVVE